MTGSGARVAAAPCGTTGALERFLVDLAAARIGLTFNQYREWLPGLDRGSDAPQRRLNNLREYLLARAGCCDTLLVGEAPGHFGARFSGIAFEAERGLPVDQRTSLHDGGYAESSATIVNRVLVDLGIVASTVKWNAVPTHPHRPGEPRSNRPPTRAETDAGRALLTELVEILQPARVVAVGRVAGRLLPDAPYVRHPARGGANAFRRGLQDLVHGR